MIRAIASLLLVGCIVCPVWAENNEDKLKNEIKQLRKELDKVAAEKAALTKENNKLRETMVAEVIQIRKLRDAIRELESSIPALAKELARLKLLPKMPAKERKPVGEKGSASIPPGR